MKTLSAVLLSGILLTAAASAQRNDFGASERFRMKFGGTAPTHAAIHIGLREVPGTVAVAPRNDFGAEERFQMKFGRSTPMAEARQAILEVNTATWASWETAGTAVLAQRAKVDDFGAAERFRMKFGRGMPMAEAAGK